MRVSPRRNASAVTIRAEVGLSGELVVKGESEKETTSPEDVVQG